MVQLTERASRNKMYQIFNINLSGNYLSQDQMPFFCCGVPTCDSFRKLPQVFSFQTNKLPIFTKALDDSTHWGRNSMVKVGEIAFTVLSMWMLASVQTNNPSAAFSLLKCFKCLL